MTSPRPLMLILMLVLAGLATGLLAQPVEDALAQPVEDALARGEEAWRRRADGFSETRRPDAAAAAEALAAFEEAHALDPTSVRARLRLLDALWFNGHFVESDPARAKKMFSRMTSLAEETVKLAESERGAPRAKDAHFWAAISWGLYAMSHGKAASGFKGVAGKIRSHAEALIALDESFADGGGFRLLGRLHAATPKVPLFTGWIDPDRGVELLERANAISTADPRNPLFLGQALIEHGPERREEGLRLLREVAARRPDPAALIEQQESIDEAARLLAAAGEAAP